MLNQYSRLKKLEKLMIGEGLGVLYNGWLTVYSDKSYEETFLLKENSNSKDISGQRGKKQIKISLNDNPSLLTVMKELYAETQKELIAENSNMTFIFNNFYLDEQNKPLFHTPRFCMNTFA